MNKHFHKHMKHYFAILTALLSSFLGAQQGFYFDEMASKFQDKNLKIQAKHHSTISKEIHRIFDAKREAVTLLEKRKDVYVAKMRAESNMKPNQPIQISGHDYAFNSKDSATIRLKSQDSLLLNQFKNFDKAFSIQEFAIKKLSQKDQELYKNYYKQLADTINSNYKKYYSGKSNLRNTKYKKLFLNSELANSYPLIPNCQNTSDFNADWKCFSSALKNEIQNVYTIPDFMYSDNGTYKTRTFFMIDKNGKMKAIENTNSSGSYFFDMLAMDITNQLFFDSKLTVTTPYLAELPLTFVVE